MSGKVSVNKIIVNRLASGLENAASELKVRELSSQDNRSTLTASKSAQTEFSSAKISIISVNNALRRVAGHIRGVAGGFRWIDESFGR